MVIDLKVKSEDERKWDVFVDEKATGDFVFEKETLPGRYFIVLRSSTLNALGTQMAYRSFDEVRQQLDFYYRFM